MSRASQIVAEIIRQRQRQSKPWRPTKRTGYRRSGARWLTAAEVAELQAHVADCMTAKLPAVPRPATAVPTEDLCAGGNAGAAFCWEEGCGRCSPP